MKYRDIISRIVNENVLQRKEINIEQKQIYKQYNDLVNLMKAISSYRTTSVYFKYNGKYFLFICDNYSFYYLGDKKIKNKFYFQLF